MSPMSTRSTFGAVRAKALRLSPLERARLTNDLFASLGRRRLAAIEQAWEEEIGRRVTSYRAGAMPTTPARAVMEDVRREYVARV